MTPKICLNMIVKNEAKIITRLFDSIKDIVDDYVIIDTGSTDNTKEIIKNYWNQYNINGHIIDIPFKNFGYNRTQGLIKAREKSNSDFILLLDADMVIKNINFNKKELISKEAISLKQKNRYIEYRNLRLIKKDIPAICVGVTHEYYDTKGAKIENIDSIYIEDIGDGGAKTDKFERDIRLLKEALKEEPNNNRYYFYLAQSYKDTGDIDNAIENYKKHITIPGWDEEIWYSHYMISKLFLLKNMPEEAEYWAMKGFSYRPVRAEALYHLCSYFKNNKNYQKAYSYYQLAKSLPFPKNDILFVEYKTYEFELEFENSIINFYIPFVDKKYGMKSCLKLIDSNIDEHRKELTLKNMNFYISSLKNNNLFKSIRFDQNKITINDIEYLASSPSLFKNDKYKIANIRHVSYKLTNEPMIFHNDKENLIQTKNIRYCFKNKSYYIMNEKILYPSKHEKINGYIRGIEDIRLFEFNNKIKFIGQSGDYKNIGSNIRFNMVIGEYDINNNNLIIEQILESPYNNSVEKNWINLKDDLFIYKWYPLEIGTLEDKSFVLKNRINTPQIFKHFKGSTNGVFYKNMYWFLTHYTTDDWKNGKLWRRYKHCIVLLDESFNVISYSNPFTFEGELVEYSLGMYIENNKIIIGYSLNEKDASLGELDISYIFDNLNILDEKVFYKNIL